MKIVRYQGKDTEVQEVEVITSNEPWNEYQLADGTVLMLKTVLLRVQKALSEKTPEGEPLVIVQAHSVVRTK